MIVELGCIRSPRQTEGNSTLNWPDWATVFSVDNNLKAIRLSKQLTAELDNVFLIWADGLEFLKRFPTAIDLLYLDGPHPDREDGRDWHNKAFNLAPMAESSVVLIDDTDLPRRGKGELVIPSAERVGYKLQRCHRQALLVKGG